MDTTSNFRINRMSPQLLVVDLDRSIDFYTKVLGFSVEFQYEDFYAGIIKDGCSIHLKEGYLSFDRRKEGNENLDIVFSVEGIEDFYRVISGRSVEIVQALRKMPYGKEFYLADPDGNVIAFSGT